ncbi:hypothetical protein [Paraburkholderia rhynchosiae]|uniref:hypothetical protein n=1 Tax=Paraburkholderia rhynchosiae TaxID=487049 RepID=UPI0011AF838F|nr:hypothetical protein [Paraburkholderia rhynchosiae]
MAPARGEVIDRNWENDDDDALISGGWSHVRAPSPASVLRGADSSGYVSIITHCARNARTVSTDFLAFERHP